MVAANGGRTPGSGTHVGRAAGGGWQASARPASGPRGTGGGPPAQPRDAGRAGERGASGRRRAKGPHATWRYARASTLARWRPPTVLPSDRRTKYQIISASLRTVRDKTVVSAR